MGRQYVLSALFASLWLSGCMMFEPQPDDPAYAPIPPEYAMPPEKMNGSIYQAGFNQLWLYGDDKARQVGDILTVVLNETTTSSKTAETATSKNSELDMTATLPTDIPLRNVLPNPNQTADQSRDFDGTAESAQENELVGSISVTVSRVLSNGNLMVRGEKWLTLTTGREYIRLTGIVRPRDITPDNTVESTKVANARIAYSGTGSFADTAKEGWLIRFFNSVIWPY